MVTTPAYLSASNGWLPEATGQAIAFVRNPSRFKIMEYVQLINCPKPLVAYATLDFDQPARVPNTDMNRWPDGNFRPAGNNNMGNFLWHEVLTERYDYPYTVGYQAIESAAGWNPKAFFNSIILQQAMTLCTQRFVNLYENPANWGTNTADANTLNGGFGNWVNAESDPGSPNYLAIQKSVLTAAKNIMLATNGQISIQDLILVVSPGLAEIMANTSEIHTYLSKQERSLRVLQGAEPNMAATWGLPQPFCGMKVVVEDAVIVKELPNITGTPATTNRLWCKSDTSALITSRIGGVDGDYGSASASTLQKYFYKYEMAVETFDSPENKLFSTHVVDQFKEVLAAPRAGYLITSCS